MKDPDLHAAGKLVADTAAGATVMYYLHGGRQRPLRDDATREGGLLPNPQPDNTVEAVGFWAGGMILRWLILKFILLPLFAVWAALTIGPMLLVCQAQTITSGNLDPTCVEPGNPHNLCGPLLYHQHWHNVWFAIVWGALALYLGFKFFRHLWHLLEGRPRTGRVSSSVRVYTPPDVPQLLPPRSLP